MPVTIYVRSADEDAPREACPSLTFDGPRVVIGRGESCDVRLPDSSVSHRHATLEVAAGGVTIADEGSRNGTYVGTRRLAMRAPHTLRAGESVRVGRVWLDILLDQRPATRDMSLATKDLALALVTRAMKSMGTDGSPRIRVEDGPDYGTEIVLAEEGRAYVIGRGETCDLPLADEDASREHLQVVRRGSVVLVRDLGSKNGAELDGTLVPGDRDTTWKASQRIGLASTVLTLSDPAAAALKSIEESPDEPLAEADIPPPPSKTRPPTSPSTSGARPSPEGGGREGEHREPAAINHPSTAAPAPLVAPRARMAPTDTGIVIAAVLIFALSLAGLFWLLRT